LVQPFVTVFAVGARRATFGYRVKACAG